MVESMNIIKLFPTDIFEFYNASISTEQVISDLTALPSPLKNSSNISYTHNIHRLEKFKNLFSWFEACLEKIRNHNQYNCEKFEITTSWYNKSVAGKGMHQNYHKHTMSFFSGVYYLTEGSPTVFEDPMYQRTNAQIEVLRHNYQPFEHIRATPGKLILFPSWIYHQSPPHCQDFDRWIISFNSLPTGKINIGAHDASCFISIKDLND